MSDFSIKDKELIDYTLGLQRINDVSLAFAIQDTLNAVVRDTKKRTLAQVTNQMFDVKRKNFFKANSGFKQYKAKQFNYNINKLKASISILKSTKPNEKATEQLANQPTASPIKRKINPAGDKPQPKSIINILTKKPEFYDAAKTYPEGNSFAFTNKARRAKSRGAGFIVARNGKGYINRVVSIKKRKPTRADKRKMVIKMKAIGSYNKNGQVKLKKPAPFLTTARDKSVKEIMNNEFVKNAEKQMEMAIKRKNK
jgi:hypothetical protein